MTYNCPVMTMRNKDYQGTRCMVSDCAWWDKEYDCCCFKALVKMLRK